jgi:hypothetical protein
VTETAWTAEQLDAIGAAQELRLAARGSDGTLRVPVPIWVVRVGDELFVRSWRGADGAWYRAVQASGAGRVSAGGVEADAALVAGGDDDAIDAAYREKYASYPSHVGPMVTDQARATTLRLVATER